MPGGGDGGFAVWTASDLDLTGWQVGDGEGAWTFPAGSHASAGQPLWVVADPTTWTSHQGPQPILPLAAGTTAGHFILANQADSLTLQSPTGAAVDSVAWGNATATNWAGKLRSVTPGLILQRDQAAASWVDTNQAADWVTPRMHKIGESHLDQPTFHVSKLTLYASPDSSFGTLTNLLSTAKSRLQLHVYQLRSEALVDSIVAAKRAQPSLDLQVLVDDNPVGTTAPQRHATADALQRIQDAGGHVVLAGNGRYDDFHLKVLVVDDAVAVQSENWVESGVPEDPTTGNRGWGAVVWDAACADWFANWLAADRASWDTHAFDLKAFDPTYEKPLRSVPRTGEYGHIVPAKTLTGDFVVTPIVSPDHTADPRTDPVAKLVQAATKRADTQQLDLAHHAANDLGWSSPDPFASALATAAGRTVPVRVLAAAPFVASDLGNQPELDWLSARGVQAEIIDRKGIETLHNKGLVADEWVVLGSMNANHHSRSANREVDLALSGPGVADYYEALFTSDWGHATRDRDSSVIGKDLHALPAAPLPILLVVLGVAILVARSRPCR